MNQPILDCLEKQPNPLAHNRELLKVLEDDGKRAALYKELHGRVLPFRSVLRTGGAAEWPSEDVYLLTAREDIKEALQKDSVAPYSQLDSGGKFMLGLDDAAAHDPQRSHAAHALRIFGLQAFLDEALARAFVLPRKLDVFDLVNDVAEQAALRLLALVFGMPARAHLLLESALRATYTRLTFQIIGRHFSPDDGLPSSDSARAKELRAELEERVRCAAKGEDFPEWWDTEIWDSGPRKPSGAVLLKEAYPQDEEMTRTVILGLMAGTVGNVKSAVANIIDHLFQEKDDQGNPLIDEAIVRARSDDPAPLEAMMNDAMFARPPAPFLARTAERAIKVRGLEGDIHIPKGAHLLLAMGAGAPDLDLIFGGGNDSYMHRCVGRHLALPLVYATVREVLRLPGLSLVIDPATGRPKPLVKRWGAICLEFPLRYRRDRRLNQQPLFLVLPILEPIAENAFKLVALTRAGAPVIERALEEAKNVHFAWFGLVEGGTHLAMYTVYDGDFDAYVEHFALKVPLFDEQFRFLKGAPRTPVRDFPKDFVNFIRDHNRAPAAHYFYSAYPELGVAEIHNLAKGQP